MLIFGQTWPMRLSDVSCGPWGEKFTHTSCSTWRNGG